MKLQQLRYIWEVAHHDLNVSATAQREGRLTRNRLGYTDRPVRHVLAAGLGAVIELDSLIARNTARLDQWQHSLENAKHPVIAGLRYSEAESTRRNMLYRLSESQPIARSAFAAGDAKRFLDELLAAGLVDVDEHWVHVSQPGRIKLVQSWDSSQGDLTRLARA